MKIPLTVALIFASASVLAQVDVSGYTKKDGTYVQPHHRTTPNGTNLDNYSTKGNVNPYTGQLGTKAPEPFGTQPAQPVQPVQPSSPAQQLQPLQPLSLQPLKPLKPLNLF